MWKREAGRNKIDNEKNNEEEKQNQEEKQNEEEKNNEEEEHHEDNDEVVSPLIMHWMRSQERAAWKYRNKGWANLFHTADKLQQKQYWRELSEANLKAHNAQQAANAEEEDGHKDEKEEDANDDNDTNASVKVQRYIEPILNQENMDQRMAALTEQIAITEQLETLIKYEVFCMMHGDWRHLRQLKAQKTELIKQLASLFWMWRSLMTHDSAAGIEVEYQRLSWISRDWLI